jgi:hypothetical protein
MLNELEVLARTNPEYLLTEERQKTNKRPSSIRLISRVDIQDFGAPTFGVRGYDKGSPEPSPAIVSASRRLSTTLMSAGD